MLKFTSYKKFTNFHKEKTFYLLLSISISFHFFETIIVVIELGILDLNYLHTEPDSQNVNFYCFSYIIARIVKYSMERGFLKLSLSMSHFLKASILNDLLCQQTNNKYRLYLLGHRGRRICCVFIFGYTEGCVNINKNFSY